ncbi:MAG: Rieske (2Fe-2S) protein, partial [Parvularculaceae bacterium]|nr:Rieske (2Fe-2S) protein [Parvularculaceae bacterium]
MSKEIVGKVAAAMLDYVENNKTFMTERSMTVPTRSYTDADQWGAEMELIFKRTPLMLALSCEMPNPGDYKAMEAVGLPILITRDRDGDVRAFFNVCSHRGAPIARAGHGNCARFSCVYHGWT